LESLLGLLLIWILLLLIDGLYYQLTIISSNVVKLVKGMHIRELFLCKANQYGDLKQLANIVLKYASRSSCIAKIAHMEGEEIFGSYKWKANLPPNQKGIHISTSV
jgi:hypothetical protein